MKHSIECLVPYKNAKQYNEDIEGTDGRDVIKCASGMVSWVDGNIRLGDGNDEINLAAHSYQTKLEVYRKGGSEYGMIDMGSGNDTIVLNKYADLEVREIDFGEGNDKLEIKANADGIEECTLINFGDGDDVMTVAGVSEELCVGMIDMGWGNDTLELKSLTGFSRIGSISMGDGDDTVKVDDVTLHSQEGWLGILDMGEGFDTLEMNGTLCLDSVSGVDKVTGSGTLVFGMSQPDEATAKLFKDAGIDMVCAGIPDTFTNDIATNICCPDDK